MLRKHRKRLELLFAFGLIILQVACKSYQGAGSETSTVKPGLFSVGIIPVWGSGYIVEGTTEQLTTFVTGADGDVTLTWSVTAGTISRTTGDWVYYTAPATQPSPNTVTVTAKATDSGGNIATGQVTLKVTRLVTLGNALPNNELYLDFGSVITINMTCSKCEVGDTVNTQFFGRSVSPIEAYEMTDAAAITGWPQTLDLSDTLYLPGMIKFWVTGTDGSSSNWVWIAFEGSQNVAVQDPSSNEIYYADSGDGTSGSRAIYKFTPDGKADGSYAQGSDGGSEAIAFDAQTIYLTQPKPLASGTNGIATFDTGDGTNGLIPISEGEPLAIDAKAGLVCVTVPTGGDSPNSADAVDCHDSNGTFTLTGIPSGSQPAAIKVVDSSHLVVYGRGDHTLRWFTLSGNNSTSAGTLQLSDFTATDANYWNNYPATGGWYLALVNGTLGVMGQVVNGDGTVSQKLALVDNTAQTLKQYIELPDGTIRIAPDPTNNAIVAEFLSGLSSGAPNTWFERVYADTGNNMLLTSTSILTPGAGFLVTNDGSRLAIFDGGGSYILNLVEGKADFQPNQ